MTEFEKVLHECLLDMERGASNVDTCLVRHPKHASELRPILLTSAYLERGREARPSAAFKARVRAKLTREMQAYPRRSRQFNFGFLRLAASFAVIILAFLVTATAYAQSALPGGVFYPWKLVSENVWRAVSPDPVGTDLAISKRRANELIAVRDDPALYSQTLAAYLEVVSRLRSEMNAENEARILLELDSQMDALSETGILIPQLDQNEDVLPATGEPLLTPTATPSSMLPAPTTIPLLTAPSTPEPPVVNPTDVPNIVPTVDVPTIQIPSLLP